MIINGKVSIGRPSRGDLKSVIRIEITDAKSRKKFLRIEMSPEDFALALTGMSETDADIELSHVPLLGKTKESEALTIHLNHDLMLEEGISSSSKPQMSKYIEEHAANYVKPGWELNPALNSQGSLFYPKDHDGVILNVTQYRYVDPV